VKYLLDELSAEISLILASTQPAKVGVIGQSLGGYTALARVLPLNEDTKTTVMISTISGMCRCCSSVAPSKLPPSHYNLHDQESAAIKLSTDY